MCTSTIYSHTHIHTHTHTHTHTNTHTPQITHFTFVPTLVAVTQSLLTSVDANTQSTIPPPENQSSMYSRAFRPQLLLVDLEVGLLQLLLGHHE